MQQEIQRATDYHHLTTTRRICYRQLQLAVKYHKQLTHIHKELRRQSLLSLKEMRIREGNLPAATIIEKIARYEKHNEDLAIINALKDPKRPPPPSKQEQYIRQRQTINPVFHTIHQSSLNTIEIPHKDENSQPTDDSENATTWRMISDPLLIEEKLLARNIAHFGQAQGTLFTTNYFQHFFGYSGVTMELEKLLSNEFDEDNYPTMTRGATTLLNLLSNNKRLPPISTKVPVADFAKGLWRWAEETSTSPSGRHLRHYRCLFADDKFNYTDEDPDPGPKILGVYHNIATAALEWGISLKRWQNSITTIIKKQPGCSRINKLRVIHLYDADYNLLLKIIWA
jgi:hypothetical protein